MYDGLPILGICGWSGSGKTTLIEALVTRFRAQGLSVAVVKHDVHGVDLDHVGKDSDRLFRAGADALLQGPNEELFRLHTLPNSGLHELLGSVALQYDLLLVEGHKGTPLPKVWLLSAGEGEPPPHIGGILAALGRDADRVDAMAGILREWLPRQWRKTPIFGCVLALNGRRGGSVPHVPLQGDRRECLQQTVELLRQVTDEVVVPSADTLPGEWQGCVRLPDVRDAHGPLASAIAAVLLLSTKSGAWRSTGSHSVMQINW